MHAHRINVFDGADDDGVILAVAHHLHLEFLPAQKGFIDQNLCHGAGFQPGFHDGFVIVAVIGDAAAGATQGKGGADDGGQADIFQRLHRFGHAGGDVELAGGELGGGNDGGLGVFKPDAVHRFAEQLAVFGHFDGMAVGADQLNAEFFQHTQIIQRQRRVQAGLAAHGGQDRVGAFFLDDLGHHFGGDRLDIGGIRQARIRHDRGRVGVHQNDAIAFLAQGLAGLCAGIIELAGLSDDDGACSDDHDGGDIGSFRHGGPRVSVQTAFLTARGNLDSMAKRKLTRVIVRRGRGARVNALILVAG